MGVSMLSEPGRLPSHSPNIGMPSHRLGLGQSEKKKKKQRESSGSIQQALLPHCRHNVNGTPISCHVTSPKKDYTLELSQNKLFLS